MKQNEVSSVEKANITISFVNPPKSEKGPGNVKDTNGNYWKCWKETLGQFQVGSSYDITFEKGEYKGKPDNTVLTVKQSAKAPEAQQKAQQAPYAAPRYGSTDMATAERIFVCGALNAILGNQNLNPGDMTTAKIVATVNILRNAWVNTFGPAPKNNDDMNDSLDESFR